MDPFSFQVKLICSVINRCHTNLKYKPFTAGSYTDMIAYVHLFVFGHPTNEFSFPSKGILCFFFLGGLLLLYDGTGKS